ncbi:CoA pyrophosphatase [Desulfonema ishimotonii]|uniref:CoA pyrophosphatase n=2 Tax=Desulfonema ishimotonii TaxID=45657 RepID=A0A401G3U0_9BACT|nr:CoA pyrophosphatase [Desulfonema ishimotonii]
MITLPGFPMTRWPHWSHWQRHHPAAARRLSLFFATGLREGFEEMRLNPFGVKLIGPLPPERLRIFRRVIYPLVGWVSRQKHFHPNREVDRVVYIPLKSLLEPAHYACYRVQYDARIRRKLNRASQDFPCFRYEAGAESEVLWGATFRIVMTFLEIAFGFRPPPPDTLPVISGKLRGGYLGGRGDSGK